MRNKTQENVTIIMMEKQITNESDLETENSTQAQEDPIPKSIESVQTIRNKVKINLENYVEKMKAISRLINIEM